MSADFPTVDLNHRISTASKQLLSYVHPSTWEVMHRDGDDDYGFDLEVQVAPAGQVSFPFRAQLKGTTSPSISADQTTLSIALKRSTLNYYAQSQGEVMLIVAVVAFESTGKPDLARSKIYWTWISGELERLRGSRYAVDLVSDQDRVTLRIPLSQELSPDLEVEPYLRKRLEELRTSEGLAALLRDTAQPGEDTAGRLQRLLSFVKDRPDFLSMSGVLDDDALTDKGILGTQIAEGLSFIRAGRTTLAEELLNRIDRSLADRSGTLNAELLSLEGKICMQRRQRDRAAELFDQAYAVHSVEKHLLAKAEVRFLTAIDRKDVPAIQAIAESLSEVKTDDGLGLRVRVQTALGDVKGAQASIDRITDAKRAMPQLVLWSSQRRWADVRNGAERALAERPINPQEVIALNLVAARACWQQALATAAITESEGELPITGAPGMDLNALTAAWAHSEACLRGLKEVGWPLNVELLAPIAVASAAAIGRQDEALALLGEAAAARPEYADLQENVELLALGTGRVGQALQANARQGDSHGALVRRTCALFQLKDYQAAVAAALQTLDSIEQEVRQTPMALALGAAAASKLSRLRDRDRLIAVLRAEPRYAEFVYFAEFSISSLRQPGTEEALQVLRDGIEAFPNSRFLMTNLFSNLSVDEAASASEAISLAKRMRLEAVLSEVDQGRFIEACFALDQWSDAEMAARAALQRFGSSERFHSMLAIALEMQGQTAPALEALEAALAHGASRIGTLQNYLGICLRLGRLDAAREALETLLGVEGERGERLELLRLNALLLLQEGRNDEAYEVVREVGILVEASVETEEAMYLNLYLAATLRQFEPPEADRLAFWQRAATFSLVWPESSLFRKMEVPEQGFQTPDDVHSILDGVWGDSRGRRQEWAHREEQARSGKLPVPFVARPSFVLHYIGDVFTLWDVSKRSKPEDRQFHLTSCLADDAVAADDKVLRDEPILDLSALLVLQDLGLLETLLRLFRRIAIPKSTLDYISQHSRGLFVSAMTSGYATSLLAFVNDNLDRISQVSIDRRSVKIVSEQVLLADYLQLAKSGRWAVYTDDAFTRILAKREFPAMLTMNTVELMRFGEMAEALSAPEIAKMLAKLVAWNVGITVETRYLIAALDGAMQQGEKISLHERYGRFATHEPFATLTKAIWDPDKKTTDLAVHIAMFVADALRSRDSSEDSVAAVWALWLNRVKLMASMTAATSADVLALSLLLALQQLPDGTEQRGVRAMLKTLELGVEPGQMSRELQNDLVRRLGECVANIADRDLSTGEALRGRLERALPPGTSEGDIFSSAYFASLRAPSHAAPHTTDVTFH